MTNSIRNQVATLKQEMGEKAFAAALEEKRIGLVVKPDTKCRCEQDDWTADTTPDGTCPDCGCNPKDFCDVHAVERLADDDVEVSA